MTPRTWAQRTRGPAGVHVRCTPTAPATIGSRLRRPRQPLRRTAAEFRGSFRKAFINLLSSRVLWTVGLRPCGRSRAARYVRFTSFRS
jgi:hypothetical protein